MKEKKNIPIKGFFKCGNETIFLDPRKVCDKIIDCLDGSDEFFCQYPSFSKRIHSCRLNFVFSLICNFSNTKEHFNWSMERSIKNLHKIKRLDISNGEKRIKEMFNEIKEFYELNILIVKENNYFSNTTIYFKNLFYLHLENCQLNDKSPIINRENIGINILLINENPLMTLEFLKNLAATRLLHLDISNTKIKNIDDSVKDYLQNLKKLSIKNTLIKSLESLNNLKLNKLIELNILNIKIPINLFSKSVKNLKNIESLITNNLYFCCLFLKNSIKNSKFQCKIIEKNFKTCENLLGNLTEKIFLWFLIIFLFLGNIFSLFILFVAKRNVQKLQILLLFGDFCIFFYINILVFVDIHYGEKFFEMSKIWIESNLCKILGFFL